MGAADGTIAAIATPPGPGRRGIVRVSGPDAAALARATLRAGEPAFDPSLARQLVRGRFDDGRGSQPLVLFWMRGPRSFTREDVAEFHLPGAEPLLARALSRLLELGAVAARPGDFTRRAFRNGRLDLSRAEGVLAMTEAGNEAERAAAALLLDGGLERHAAAVRASLLDLVALCEAGLDFDEAETGAVPRAELCAAWRAADDALSAALAFEHRRAPPTALPRVVLLGAPNAGKSSLWNALTGGNALVSPLAGTTRDALIGTWSLPASACLLLDGPGLDPGASGTEASAQRLFEQHRRAAALELLVVDATDVGRRLVPPPAGGDPRITVWNKLDLSTARPAPLGAIAVSATQRVGLDELARHVEAALGGTGLPGLDLAGLEGGAARWLFARHGEALGAARRALAEAGKLLASEAPLDLVAEELRASLTALDELAGRSTAEDVLERVFARFCLGK